MGSVKHLKQKLIGMVLLRMQMRGAFVGDDKDKKTINKMYVVETTADTAHKIVFDASRL